MRLIAYAHAMDDPACRFRIGQYIPYFEKAGFDIGIMPLVDEPFQRGKCGCKILQYMSASLPVVASPVGINTGLIDHGCRGFLAFGKEEWREALTALIAAPKLRREMGQAGRALVEQHYSVRAWFPRLLSIIENVAGVKTPPALV